MTQGAEYRAQILDFYTKLPQPFNLAKLMYGVPNHPNPQSRQGSCFVTGIDSSAKGTSFRAFRYVSPTGSIIPNVLPYQGILTDMRWLGILYLDIQEMTILPYGDLQDGPHRNLFYDAVGMKGASVRALYTGNLADAITEFNKKKALDLI